MADWSDEDEQPIANALENVAHQIRNLGNADACTPMGGLEALGQVLKETLPCLSPNTEIIEHILSDIAAAMDQQANTLEKLAAVMSRIAFHLEHNTDL